MKILCSYLCYLEIYQSHSLLHQFALQKKSLLTRLKYPRKNSNIVAKVISVGMWPSKAVVFALVVKTDFATIPSQINNLQGQFTISTEQIRPHKYITK